MTYGILQAGWEPIQGYILREKLGAGGYGEVWSADAPGGLTKAIKFVFGAIEDERGAAEFKSLNLMRKLNHPFILSLERVEIVDGQLVIVTELAQGSLFERFGEYREKGFVGVPRDRLLRYLTDAADGLDYLCQEHDLQHLDVKPGNLLLVADRIKVADFGLMKDLQSKTDSLLNGMTPTYAAPEMFDGRPGRYSDQYSLAIVYQEMLTSTLPFRGRTAAQLANEHLHKAPNLEALPLMERPVLAKALSKKPHMRHADCREFIRALVDCRTEAKIAAERVKDAKASSVYARNLGSFQAARSLRDGLASQAVATKASDDTLFDSRDRPVRLENPMPPLGHESIESPAKILFLGLGASGGRAIRQLKARTKGEASNDAQLNSPQYLVIDTDGDTLQELTDPSQADALSKHDTHQLRLNSSQYFRQATSKDLHRIPRRWTFNIPRSMKTEGVRPLGMLAFLDQASKCYEVLADAIDDLVRSNPSNAHLKVYMMASAHGGTGGAIVSEIGFMIRQIASALDLQVEIDCLLLCAETDQQTGCDLATASAVACLEEIGKYFDSRGLHETLHCLPPTTAVDQPPFDYVTLVHGGVFGVDRDWMVGIGQMVDYVWAQGHSELDRRLTAARRVDRAKYASNPDFDGEEWLGAVGTQKLDLDSLTDPGASSERCCLIAIQAWVALLKNNIDDLEQLRRRTELECVESSLDPTWVTDLFRESRLSPQAWVRRVIEAAAKSGIEAEVALPPPASDREDRLAFALFGNMAPEEYESLVAIAEKLGLDRSVSIQRMNALVRESRQQLIDWIDRSVFGSIHGWRHCSKILGSIGDRFAKNAQRLFEISYQLAEKHDSALESAYDGTEIPSQELQFQLEALALEMRLHAVAGHLQTRFANYSWLLAQSWVDQSRQLVSDLIQSIPSLLSPLGISEETFELESPDMNWLDQDTTSRAAIAFLTDYSHVRVMETWKFHSQTRSFHRDTVHDLKEMSLQIRTVEQWDKSDTSILSDACGWSRLFGQLATESAHDAPKAETYVGERSGSELREEFKRILPKFVKYGGIVRNAILVSDDWSGLLGNSQMQQIHERMATIIPNSAAKSCLIVSVGERLDLATVIERTWPSMANLKELSHRLQCNNA